MELMFTLSRLQTNRSRTRVRGNSKCDGERKAVPSVGIEYTARAKGNFCRWQFVSWRESWSRWKLLPQSWCVGRRWSLVLYNRSGSEMGILRCSTLRR